MKNTLFILPLALALISCGQDAASVENNTKDIPHTYSEQHIREVGASDYAAAMDMVERGFRTGRISAFDAEMLKANLTYQYTEDYALAARYCKAALESDEAQNNPRTRIDALYLLSTSSYAAKDLSTCLMACTEGKEISHANGLIYDMHAFDFQAGNCLFNLDREEDGISIMQQAIDGAMGAAGSESEYWHLLYFCGNLINCHASVHDYAAVIAQSDTYEKLIAKLENFPDTNKDYLNRSRFYLELNRSIAWIHTSDNAKADEAYARMTANPYSGTPDGTYRLAEYYAEKGDVHKVRQILEKDVPYTDNDTVNRNWRLRLRWTETAYRKAGQSAEADFYRDRIEYLSELIEKKELEEKTAVKASQYDAQVYRLALTDTAKALSRSHEMEIAGLLCMVVICIFFAFALLRRKKINESSQEKTRRMEADLASLQRKVNLIARETPVASDAGPKGKTPDSLSAFIEEGKLYLHKDLSRAMAAELMGVSQQGMTKMLNQIQPDLSFPDYIKSLRIKEALLLIQGDPSLPVNEIAERSGFYNIRTFQRAFKSITGKTPRDYIQSIKSDAKS